VNLVSEFSHLPRTQEYLARLPDGLNSYPDAVVKGSLVRGISEFKTERFASRPLPSQLQAWIDAPPLASQWVSETRLVAFGIAVRESYFDTDGEYLAWTELPLTKTLRSPLYRVLFALLSPGRLVKSGSKRWGALRRGTSRELLERNENGNLGRIVFPPDLYDALYLSALLGALRIVYTMSGAQDPSVEIVESSSEFVVTEVRYDKALPRGPALD